MKSIWKLLAFVFILLAIVKVNSGCKTSKECNYYKWEQKNKFNK